MSISTDDLGRITQQTDVIGADGDKLGSINQVYTSDTTGDPAWVTVKTGLFGTQESFVPLSDASFDGDDIRVGVTKDAVRGAPRVDADGHLTPEEEDELYRYYGLHNPDGSQVHDDDRAGDRAGDRVGDEDRGSDGGHQAAAAGTAAAAGLGLAGRHDTDDRDRDDRDRDDRVGDEASGGSRLGDDRPGSHRAAEQEHDGPGRTAAAAGAGGAAGSALGGGFGRDRTDDESPDLPRDADTDDRSVAAENGPEHVERTGSAGGHDQEAVKPGERTTRLRRYVVTERVVQTVEELPDDDSSR